MFSDRNEAAVKETMESMEDTLRVIVEIGCWGGSSRGHSSTDCLIDNRPNGCWYYGVDCRDDGRRAHIDDRSDNRVFLHDDSSRIVFRWLENSHSDSDIDLIFIDGKHSVRQVLLDLRLAELLRPGGVVLMHDINYHPGPRLVFEAADPDVFEKTSLCPQRDDFGLGLLRRK